MNTDVFEDITEDKIRVTVFSDKKLRHKLKFLDDDYCLIFSKKYDIIVEDVRSSLHYVTDLSYEKMKEKIDEFIFSMKHDKNLVNYLVR